MAERKNKGKSLLGIYSDYTVVDIETTGLDSRWDEIIEIGAVRVRNNAVADTFSSLVKPERAIPEFITSLTGISDESVSNAPCIKDIMTAFFDFLGEDVLIGHNVNFDMNFLYDIGEKSGRTLDNAFVDTLRIARIVLPDMEHHRLSDVAAKLNVEHSSAHRSAEDCKATFLCYEELKRIIANNSEMQKRIERIQNTHKLRAADITAQVVAEDENHALYGKVCVITGTLERMTRKEAMQAIADCGGTNGDSVTKKTNYLILGNNDYCASIKDGKSSKQKKAESYIAQGQDIAIISENVFYDLLFDE